MGIDSLFIWLAFAFVLLAVLFLALAWYQWTTTGMAIGITSLPVDLNLNTAEG
ncbi:MAG: hypothetical protein PWP76_104 [Candidatus Diapherotrites archaeon]|nr:hypothetical protein [Candidatus Diapherotrites archaeon]MDN5366798.1 hypothetical protein [Candidatus Diapherotrites archaeon]